VGSKHEEQDRKPTPQRPPRQCLAFSPTPHSGDSSIGLRRGQGRCDLIVGPTGPQQSLEFNAPVASPQFPSRTMNNVHRQVFQMRWHGQRYWLPQ
jgi:hypothetical protein